MQYGKLVEFYEELGKTTKRLEKTHIISELLKQTPAEDLPVIMLLLEGRLFPSYDAREIGVASRIILKAISDIVKGILLALEKNRGFGPGC